MVRIINKLYFLFIRRTPFYKSGEAPKHYYAENIQTKLHENILRQIEVKNLELKKDRRGMSIRISLNDVDQTYIEYRLRYDKDGLLLLRGALSGSYLNKKTNYIISPNSIVDFAVSARPAGASYGFVWVPKHGRAKGVCLNPRLELLINGVNMCADKISNENIKSLEIVQTFVTVNPHAQNEILWQHRLSHKICVDHPYIDIKNNMQFLRDTEVRSMYLTMLPVESNKVSRLLLSNGCGYKTIPRNGASLKLEGNISGAMYLGSSSNGGYAAAVESDCDNISAKITFRKDSVSKFYLNRFRGIARSGESIESAQRIYCVSGVKDDLVLAEQ